jgi:hypothetical protein
MARLFDLGLEEYREVRGRFDVNARDAARELLEDASFAGRVDRLPFRSGEPSSASATASRTTCNPSSRSFVTCWSCGDPKAEYASSTPVYRRTRRPWCCVGLSLTAGPPRIGDATWRRRAGVWDPRARGSLPPCLTFGRCPSTPPPNTIPTGIQVKEKMMEGRSRQVERFIEQLSSATRIRPACRTHSRALSRRSRKESPH